MTAGGRRRRARRIRRRCQVVAFTTAVRCIRMGCLQAGYAEGLGILNGANAGVRARESDAETAPLENPDSYRYEGDTTEVAEFWRRDSTPNGPHGHSHDRVIVHAA
jgi:hypothetical protein